MTSQAKSQLFSRIQKEKLVKSEISSTLSTKRFFFASKRVVYTSLASILVFVVFGGLLLERNNILDFGSFSIKTNNPSNGVFADYIAEIVEFNWDYSLVRNWQTILDSQNLKLIEDWDTVSLLDWTDLVFNLQDWTQAKIVWPAEFSITKSRKWCQISLIDWKFFRIYSQESNTDMEILTPDMSIHQSKNQTLDLHIAKEENWQLLVKNAWDEVVLKTKKNEKEETKIVAMELVAIASSSSNIDVISDDDLMSTFMSKNDISSTFTLSTEKVERPTISQSNSAKTVAIHTSETKTENKKSDEVNAESQILDENKDPLLDWIKEIVISDSDITWSIDETISKELWIIEDEKQVPTIDQMDVLQSNLNGFFLMNLFESIYTQDESAKNISKLADRINAIYSTFGYSDTVSPDLNSIRNMSVKLRNKLQQDRYISPSYLLQLEKVWNRCKELNTISWDRETLIEDWNNLKSDLPTSLRLM